MVAHLDSPSELEREIESKPESTDSYLVYSDWLQEKGDPRGRLIALQHAKDSSADHFFDRHRGQILGLLDEQYHFLENIGWHLGYLESVTVHVDDGHPATDASEVLSSLLASPSARFLRSLVVRYPIGDDRVPKVLGQHNLASLKSLDIAPSGREERPNLGLAPLWFRLPNLRRLKVCAAQVSLSDLSLPDLESLKLSVYSLPAIELFADRLTHLRSLTIETAEGNATLNGILDLEYEKLERFKLGSSNPSMMQSVLQNMFVRPFFETLEVLKLNDLTIRHIEFLNRNLAELGHLESLSLHLSNQAVRALTTQEYLHPDHRFEEAIKSDVFTELRDFLGERLRFRDLRED